MVSAFGSGLSYSHGDERVKAKSRKCCVLCSILSLLFQRQLCFSQTYLFHFMILLGQQRFLNLGLKIRIRTITLIKWVKLFITVRIIINVRLFLVNKTLLLFINYVIDST